MHLYFSIRLLSFFAPILLFFLTVSGLFAGNDLPKPDFPLKLSAVAETLDLGNGRIRVKEFLDVKNESNSIIIEVRNVQAEIYTGHRLVSDNENWFDANAPIVISSGDQARVAERTRTVTGIIGRTWRIRWLKFRITTNYGEFVSNFIDSPFWYPGEVEKVTLQPRIDSESQP
ncbi:MAG: hypothetical protein HQM10_14760 [Candidatus Riflebacteria bacterium]|nr:hypothetical protein [Candidatus Riflebacteria bacterium]